MNWRVNGVSYLLGGGFLAVVAGLALGVSVLAFAGAVAIVLAVVLVYL